ncbi:insulin receptor substrate 53 kDa [Lycorma delicatula]|uniref:insulin receptor substrate 53 kDa n=1 Tax=Lycorma delicatula TaxID=130591 RepID=UPI003F513A95
METEEITKLVDGIYKNILDKFNPGARQMINAGKAYLKALHGAAAASRLYVEAITKLARQSQQGTWGGSADIGSALMQIVEVYKEIQAQQMNILKAFYVDLLVPLETNLEKDTKVVQSEQKRFLQQHKQRSETYSKAAATMKKHRKKQQRSTKSGLAMDKELKSMQVLEEERSKLDAFCEQSLKNAMTQERRRYGFVLERQCSLAKHYLAYHSAGHTIYQNHLEDWQEVAKTREYLPESVEAMFTNRLRQVSFWSEEEGGPGSPRVEDDRVSLSSQLRKTKSMDASCLDVRAINDISSPGLGPHTTLTRAKSDFNLTASTHSLAQDVENTSPTTRPKSMAVADSGGWENPLARALYAYLSSGENQLSFLEGDVIALMGERNKGWQFGENLRTQQSGWFPLAYTEMLIDTNDTGTNSSPPSHRRQDSVATTPGGFSAGSPGGSSPGNPTPRTLATPLTRFGDTLAYRHTQQGRSGNENSFSAGPPGVPAPVAPQQGARRAPPPLPPLPPHPQTLPASRQPPNKRQPPANASLHSSNDSGFSNDPPPAPEVDYSDDEANRRTTLMKNQRNRTEKNSNINGMEHSNSNGKKHTLSSIHGWLGDNSNDWYSDQEISKNIHKPVRQSSSVGHLSTLNRSREMLMDNPKLEYKMQMKAVDIPYEKKLKRTRSLWKFKKTDEVLEGMALWKHRSLVDVSGTVGKDGTPILGKKQMSLSKEQDNNSNEDVSDETLVNGDRKERERDREREIPVRTSNNRRGSVDSEDTDDDDDDENDDTESCIVVDDQHKAKVSSMLPRTHLIRTKSRADQEAHNSDSDLHVRSQQRKMQHRSQAAGDLHRPWFDPWDNE